MPGRFVYWMNVSADLRIELTPGEQGGGDWMRIGAGFEQGVTLHRHAVRSVPA